MGGIQTTVYYRVHNFLELSSEIDIISWKRLLPVWMEDGGLRRVACHKKITAAVLL